MTSITQRRRRRSSASLSPAHPPPPLRRSSRLCIPSISLPPPPSPSPPIYLSTGTSPSVGGFQGGDSALHGGWPLGSHDPPPILSVVSEHRLTHSVLCPSPSPLPSSPSHNLPPPPLPTVKKNSLIQQTIKNHIDYLNNQKVLVRDSLPPLQRYHSHFQRYFTFSLYK